MSRTRLCFTLYFLLLSVTPAEFFDVLRHEPVQASAGDDVILPCHLEPPFDVSELTVEWTRDGHTVHVYRHMKDDGGLQDEQFRGRTSLFHHEMIRGNISLKLTKVTEEDSGLYFCNVPGLESQVKRGKVLLTVDSSNVVGHEPVQVEVGGDVILPCHLDPPFDLSRLVVDWTRDDHTVHLYRHRNDDYDFQLQQFRGRTSMFHSELSRGNISLKLSNVRLEDSGLYVCYVPRLENQVKEGNVFLIVNPQKDPAGSGGNDETEDDKKESGVQRGAIAVSIVGAVFLVLTAVSAVIVIHRHSKRRRREENNLGNKQKDNQWREGPDTEEKKPLGPVHV